MYVTTLIMVNTNNKVTENSQHKFAEAFMMHIGLRSCCCFRFPGCFKGAARWEMALWQAVLWWSPWVVALAKRAVSAMDQPGALSVDLWKCRAGGRDHSPASVFFTLWKTPVEKPQRANPRWQCFDKQFTDGCYWSTKFTYCIRRF